MISESQFQASAQAIGCEAAVIKAVDKVESGGSGFTEIDGKPRPVILFEPHVFWKELKKIDIDPLDYAKKTIPLKTKSGIIQMPIDDTKNPILYPVWGARPYPRGQVSQYERLDRAAKINREAALQSCSWGRFQILGNNWRMCKCSGLQQFINAMYQSEDEHLRLFTNYILSAGLDDELRYKNWKGFAAGYNGAAYFRNGYHLKLPAAYQTFK